MPLNVRIAIVTAFLLISMIFIVIVGYTTDLYFAVFVTVREFSVTIPNLNVKVVNSSYVVIKTPITIQNPSECGLEVTSIREGLWLENVFVLSGSLATLGNPIQLHPKSTVNVTIEAEVPSHRIQYVTTQLEKNWRADLRIFLRAPIAGTYSWQNSWYITEVTKN